MKKDRGRYLFVDTKDVFKMDHVNYKDIPLYEREDAGKIFSESNIDDVFSKIIFRINPFYEYYEMVEYFTGIPFDYTGYTRFKKNEEKYIRARSIISKCNNFIEFKTPMEFHDLDDVNEFYSKLKDRNMDTKYLNTLIEFFNDVKIRNINSDKKLIRK